MITRKMLRNSRICDTMPRRLRADIPIESVSLQNFWRYVRPRIEKGADAEPILGSDSRLRHVSCGARAAPSLERITSTLDTLNGQMVQDSGRLLSRASNGTDDI